MLAAIYGIIGFGHQRPVHACAFSAPCTAPHRTHSPLGLHPVPRRQVVYRIEEQNRGHLNPHFTAYVAHGRTPKVVSSELLLDTLLVGDDAVINLIGFTNYLLFGADDAAPMVVEGLVLCVAQAVHLSVLCLTSTSRRKEGCQGSY